MHPDEYESFRRHAKDKTLNIEGYKFKAGKKQLLIYRVRRENHGTRGEGEAEIHVHLAQNGNGTVTGANIRWNNDGHNDALEIDENSTIVAMCLKHYFPDESRRQMDK